MALPSANVRCVLPRLSGPVTAVAVELLLSVWGATEQPDPADASGRHYRHDYAHTLHSLLAGWAGAPQLTSGISSTAAAAAQPPQQVSLPAHPNNHATLLRVSLPEACVFDYMPWRLGVGGAKLGHAHCRVPPALSEPSW